MQSVTADAVVFVGNEVLLVKRNTEPFKDCWALPGGHLDPTDKDTQETADRELKEETGVDADSDNVYFKGKVNCYDTIDRDPRGRYITVAYFYCLREKPEITIQEDEVKEARWFDIYKINSETNLAFDHFHILLDANEQSLRRNRV
jgi:8-oxo-dGTP diphosphatase